MIWLTPAAEPILDQALFGRPLVDSLLMDSPLGCRKCSGGFRRGHDFGWFTRRRQCRVRAAVPEENRKPAGTLLPPSRGSTLMIRWIFLGLTAIQWECTIHASLGRMYSTRRAFS